MRHQTNRDGKAMSDFAKRILSKLARKVLADPTRTSDEDKLASGVLALLGEAKR